MKKLVLLTLALLCLCLCTSCNIGVSKEEVETTVSFVAGTSKYLAQSNYTSDSDVNNFYWKYNVAVNDVANDDWFWFNTDAAGLVATQKGFSNLKDRRYIGRTYFFSVRGYSDPQGNHLVWSGKATTEVKYTISKVIVPIILNYEGTGSLSFDIDSPPIIEELTYNDKVKIEFEDSRKQLWDYFTMSLCQLKDSFVFTSSSNSLLVTPTDFSTAYTTELNATYSGLENRYSYVNEPGKPFMDNIPAGDYLMTIQQWTYDYETESFIQVPTRKQVFVVSIIADTNNLVKGSLDSTIHAWEVVTTHNYASERHLIDIDSTTNTKDVPDGFVKTLYTPVMDSKTKLTDSDITWFLNGDPVDNCCLAPITKDEAIQIISELKKNTTRTDINYTTDEELDVVTSKLDEEYRPTKSYLEIVGNNIYFYRHKSDLNQYILSCTYKVNTYQAESLTKTLK